MMIHNDETLRQILGAPDGTTVEEGILNNELRYDPPPSQWTPDWDAFHQHITSLNGSDESVDLDVDFGTMNMILEIEITPVPLHILSTLLPKNCPNGEGREEMKRLSRFPWSLLRKNKYSSDERGSQETTRGESTTVEGGGKGKILKAINERSLYVAARNTKTSKETFLHLIQYIVQFQNNSIDKDDNNTNPSLSSPSQLLKLINTKLLHECAQSNTIGAAKAIIEWNPSTLGSTTAIGLLPVHSALSYQNHSLRRSDMVRLLLTETLNHSIGVGNSGDGLEQDFVLNPYLYSRVMGKGRAVLQKGRSSGQNTNHIVSRRGGAKHPIELALYYLRQKYSFNKDDCEDEWECLSICYEFMQKQQPSFQLLSYIITLDVVMNPMLLDDIVKRFHIDFNDADERNGMTPLIVAIEKRRDYYIRRLLSIQKDCAKNKIQSCVLDNGLRYENCFPLHIALNEGLKWDEGLREIYESYCEAANTIDPKTGLYPYMVAAAVQNPMEDCYHLLRCNPGIVEVVAVMTSSTNASSQHQLQNIIAKGVSKHYHHLIVGVMLSIVTYLFKMWFDIQFLATPN